MVGHNRRSVLKAGAATGLGLACYAAVGSAHAETTTDSAPDPEEYDGVLDRMDGNGSEESPYIVTDIVELQAMAGDLSAHYELGNDIDASETSGWNVSDEISDDFLGDGDLKEHELSFAPAVEGSERLTLNGDPIDDGEYEIDYETGKITFDVELGEPQDDITASYRATEPVAHGFRPIGAPSDPFDGRFSGSGFEIRGLVVNRPKTDVGLFGRSEGTIERVGVVDANVTGGRNVGAVCGINWSGTVRESYATGTVVSSTSFAGGLVGNNLFDGVITKSHARADVIATGVAGGLVGINTAEEISESYAAGSVTSGISPGGLVGMNSGEEVTASYWDVAASGLEESDGGEGVGELDDVPSATEMTGSDATERLSGFDFTDTWQTVTDPDGYPLLAWQDPDDFRDDPAESGDPDDTADPEGESDDSDDTADSEGESDDSAGSEDDSDDRADSDDPDDSDDLEESSDDSDDLEESSDDSDGDASGNDELPGPGIGGALGSIGGTVYLLKRRLEGSRAER